jgi:hypothetical protein
MVRDMMSWALFLITGLAELALVSFSAATMEYAHLCSARVTGTNVRAGNSMRQNSE